MSSFSNDNENDKNSSISSLEPSLAPLATPIRRSELSFSTPQEMAARPGPLHSRPHRRRHKNHAVSAHEQHGNGSFGGLVDLLVCLLIDVDGGDGLFHVTEDHVQVLVVRMQASLQFPLIAHFDLDALIQTEFDEVK